MTYSQLKRSITVLRDTPANKEKRRRIMADLNGQLKQLDLIGEVVSIVTYQQTRNTVRCYGHYIPSQRLFAVLNLNTNTRVRYPRLSQLANWREGHFVQLEEFEPRYEDRWVALIRVTVNDLEGKAIPFPQSPNP